MKGFVDNWGSLPSAVPLPLKISSAMASDQVKGFSKRTGFSTIKNINKLPNFSLPLHSDPRLDTTSSNLILDQKPRSVEICSPDLQVLLQHVTTWLCMDAQGTGH